MRADIVLGVITVLMALAGGIVSVHAPKKWPGKIAYAAIFAVLGALSFVFVVRQSNENAIANQNLTNALNSLKESTSKISEMTALNAQLQDKLLKQGDTITDLSKQNIAAVTGGSTYCYVIASDVGDSFLLTISTVGKSPLHNINVDMVDMDKERTIKPSEFTWDAIQSFTKSYPNVPALASSSGRILDRIPIGTAGDSRNLHFNFFSINGVWGETLKLRRVNGQWMQAIQVKREIAGRKNNRTKTLYEFVPPNYPKVNGKVDW